MFRKERAKGISGQTTEEERNKWDYFNLRLVLENRIANSGLGNFKFIFNEWNLNGQ